jgi:hypothetical protein
MLILSGCVGDNENPVNGKSDPPGVEPEYHLVMDMYTPNDDQHQDDYYLITTSTLSGTLVDSVAMSPGFDRITFSHDGTMTCFSDYHISGRRTWLETWPGHDTLGLIEGTWSTVAFSPDDQYLLVGISLYSIPELTPIYETPPLHFNSSFIPGRELFCYNVFPDESIYFVDYSQGPPLEYSLPVKEPSGKPMAVAAFCPSKSGDSLILATQNGENGVYQRYIAVVATDDLKVYDLVPYEGAFFQYSTPVLHPDGNRVYFYYQGSSIITSKASGCNATNGTVYEYNILTQELSILVNEDDVGTFYPMQLAVTPGGESLYILDEWGRVLKVRLSNYNITQPLPYLDGKTMAMAIYPYAIDE